MGAAGWTVVYLPPHWQLRLVACMFIVWLLVIGVILGSAAAISARTGWLRPC